MVGRQGAGYGAHFSFGVVIEVAAAGENFHALKTGAGNLAQKFGREAARYELVGREDSLHKLAVKSLSRKPGREKCDAGWVDAI